MSLIHRNSRHVKKHWFSLLTVRRRKGIIEVLTIDYMSPEESEYEESDENSDNPELSKLIIRKLQWRSDELTRELKSLDRKSYRSKSQGAHRMMVKREVGGFIADSLHSHPSETPAWALVGSLIPRC